MAYCNFQSQGGDLKLCQKTGDGGWYFGFCSVALVMSNWHLLCSNFTLPGKAQSVIILLYNCTNVHPFCSM
jgi:hypothetical protein